MAKPRRKPVPERWIITEADREAIRQGYYWDQSYADHVIEFFHTYLYHSAGRFAGKRFILEPWELDYVSRLFAWRRPGGIRRFTESYCEIPKKNGKSSLAAGLALYLMGDEKGAEVYQGAANRKQAGIIYREAARMVAASPALRKRFKAHPSKNTITYQAGGARLKSLSADADSEDGANASGVIFDEVHRFPNRRLYDVMEYAGAARMEPLRLGFTTAGFDRYSLCYELHKIAAAILDGTSLNLDFLPLIYGVADGVPDEALDDPELWAKVNPSLGTILSMDAFRKDFDKAKKLPATWNNFKRLRLNIWTEAATKWLDRPLWDSLAESNFPDEPAFDPSGRECFVAGDLSSNKDLTALAFGFPGEPGEPMHFRYAFFVPEECVQQRSDVDKVSYREWIEAGHIIATKGAVVDYAYVEQYLLDRRDIDGWDITKIGLDPFNATHLLTRLDDQGFDVVRYPQTYRALNGPCKEVERRIVNGDLRHDGNPVASWCIGNCSVQENAEGSIIPSKKKSTERIDAVPATVMVIGLSMGPGEPEAGIVVLKRGD